MSEFEQQGRTDHLDLILHAIFAGYQTGVLHVERGKGGVREGGDIVILRGQLVTATAGARRGDEALEWLLTWGNCQYNFQEKSPDEIAFPPPPPVSLPVTPPPEGPVIAPLKFSNELLTQNLLRIFGSGVDKEAPAPSSNAGYAPLPTHLVPLSHQHERQEPLGFTREMPAAQAAPAFPVPATPAPVVRVPIRVLSGSPALALLDRYRFPRVYRHVFLLLDGKRTARDLVRLTGHPLGDIERLLVDLERIGLIRWEISS